MCDPNEDDEAVRSTARSGGYIVYGDECHSFDRARCIGDDFGELTIEAEGERCMFDLPELVWQSRTGWIQDVIGWPWPYDVAWDEPEQDRLDRLGFVVIPDIEPLDDCALWIPNQFLELVRIQVTFVDVDVPRRLVAAEIRAVAMSEAGDFCEEFELWLQCDYTGDLREDDW